MSATLPPGTYPPPNTALSEFEVAAVFVTGSAASPKLAAVPGDAMVIKSTVFEYDAGCLFPE